MLQEGSLIAVTANPRHRWENPFIRLRKGENRLYKCATGIEQNRWILNGRPYVRAEMVNKKGHGTGYYHYFGLDEIQPVNLEVVDLDRFM